MKEESRSLSQIPQSIPLPCFKGWDIFLILGGRLIRISVFTTFHV